jgi:hypothetical protein
MGRSSSWLISALIHGALLLGAATVALTYDVVFDASRDSSGFQCGMRERTWVFDRIDRTPDHFQRKAPGPGTPSIANEEDIWGSRRGDEFEEDSVDP